MSRFRLLAGVALALGLAAPGLALALTLDDAIGLALQHDPGLRRAQAERAAADARLQEARAGGLPSLVISGSVGAASTGYGNFFGFGQRSLTPSTAQITLTQPIWTGGAVGAGVSQAKAGQAAAGSGYAGVRLALIADVAQAYVQVRTAEQAVALQQAQLDELVLVRSQAQRRFDDGEVSRTDVDQAQARLSGARAALASGQGDLARARARYRTLVGEEPVGLAPPGEPPATPESLDDAVSAARAGNPGVAAAEAALRAAEAGVRRAQAEGAPTLAVVAEASSVRDQFLPGYRADGGGVGLQGRWPLFTGGLVSGKVSEAKADVRAAEAALDQARAASEEAAIDAWQARRTADQVAQAAADQARAAEAALDSVRNEVRVGARPTLDLLDAEKEALGARIGQLQAEGARTVAAYRLMAAIGK
jgi:TolC family type I secretion outer membrane protein